MGRRRGRRAFGRWALRLALLPAALLLATPAASDPAEEAALAESLALARYHEGFPPEYGARITDAGAARLAELLFDAEYARHHATLTEALAASGRPIAFDALKAYAEQQAGERIDFRRFRALRALPLAMGRLARSDDRALAWLEQAAAKRGPAPFHTRSADAATVGRRLRLQALYGLAVSGRPEALALLRAAAASDDPRDAVVARDALETHAKAAAEAAR